MDLMKRRSFLKQTGAMTAAWVLPACKMLAAKRPSRAQKEKPDYTSRVPKYTFARTLQEQQAQLKTNSLILRFIESRKKMSGDPYRPIYHYVNPEIRIREMPFAPSSANGPS
ncbi:hypothetical protein ACFL5Z_15855, partial [Planctomycetota bacterium]